MAGMVVEPVLFTTNDEGTYFSCELHSLRPAVNTSRAGDEGTNLRELEQSVT